MRPSGSHATTTLSEGKGRCQRCADKGRPARLPSRMGAVHCSSSSSSISSSTHDPLSITRAATSSVDGVWIRHQRHGSYAKCRLDRRHGRPGTAEPPGPQPIAVGVRVARPGRPGAGGTAATAAMSSNGRALTLHCVLGWDMRWKVCGEGDLKTFKSVEGRAGARGQGQGQARGRTSARGGHRWANGPGAHRPCGARNSSVHPLYTMLHRTMRERHVLHCRLAMCIHARSNV